MGSRYDNPARFIKRLSERPKRLTLPEPEKFTEFVAAVENGGGGFSKRCAELVRFLAFGGFRKNEAASITWADCDFDKGEIVVRGDPETGTKNWTIRRVPMISDMRKLLERLKTENPGPALESGNARAGMSESDESGGERDWHGADHTSRPAASFRDTLHRIRC